MKEIGLRKTANKKKAKKHKNTKKIVGNPHLGADQPFEFNLKRGRPWGSTTISKAQKAPQG